MEERRRKKESSKRRRLHKEKNTVENNVDPIERGRQKFQLAELCGNATVFRCT